MHAFYLQVKWDVINRKDVPKKVKAIPRAPLVLIWEMILVVTVACSASVRDHKMKCQNSLTIMTTQLWFRTGTDLSRTIWNPFSQTQSDTERHAMPHTGGRNEVPESPEDGSPTLSYVQIYSTSKHPQAFVIMIGVDIKQNKTDLSGHPSWTPIM